MGSGSYEESAYDWFGSCVYLFVDGKTVAVGTFKTVYMTLVMYVGINTIAVLWFRSEMI